MGGAKIIRESYLILMESVPDQFDLESIRSDIKGIEGVEDVHEMHLWTVTSNHYSLTAHVFIREGPKPLGIISEITQLLQDKYGIIHSTIQLEDPSIHDHGPYGKGLCLTVPKYNNT